ncbi:MAG: twin-arginine translocase subunit TatC [Alistipes finegoldii]
MIDVNQHSSTVIVIAGLGAGVPAAAGLLPDPYGLVSSSFLKRYRRHAVGLLVIAAIITPPDIFSLILVIIPFTGSTNLASVFPPASNAAMRRTEPWQPL